ncbi:DODA-type extradiol aromatic ring-opening family dioxygenase [Aneurinibacillus terranovensis]|uniref:DODA-type extradiol aromatic ring-opening family dioxygenase n=1 Tax=Aneurinibacillus terranovensis TaxID=278991 RepID=UPI000402FD17|nr:class III extradiol ring-cleavage dioxygenase [Aneurinibacillus terranovensis]
MVPSLFLAHGSPMLAIENTEYTGFLKKFAQPIKPKAIVIFTAHWESDILTISSTEHVYETIYDFYGFPDELYSIKYQAKGSKQIASMVEERFKKHRIAARQDTARGLDHGSWTLLYRMYPEADIPVVQVSVNPYLVAEEQFKIGQALQGMGKEDILVIGSGVTVHNLRAVKWGETTPEPWAVEFDDWLIDKIQNRELPSLFHYEKEAPHARLAVPRPEHFVPLLIAMGSGNQETEAKVIHRSYDMGSLSYLCLQF